MINFERFRPGNSLPGPSLEHDDAHAILFRSRVFAAVITLLFLGLIVRLWVLQIVDGDDYRTAALANEARHISSHPPRGAIVDCHGILLATNRSRLAVYATPDVVKDPDELRRLAPMLGASPEQIRTAIRQSEQNPYDAVQIALDVPMSAITQVEENKPFLPGVSTSPVPVRWYPGGDLASHVLGTMGRISGQEYERLRGQGYLSDDFVGTTGIEHYYDSYLHGKPGDTQIQIDAKGRRVRTLGSNSSQPGDTVVLALDSRVQAAAEQSFRNNGFTGAAVALDPRNGAVRALVSAPDFDPNKFSSGIRASDWAPLNGNPKHPLIDRAVDAMYPPGSTFKPIVAAAGLQTGCITTNTSAYCPGAYYLGRARFGCWERHGAVDFYSAIAESCDVFFYIAGRAIGPERISDYAKSFGLAEKTGIDLPSEDIGSIPSPQWKAAKYKRLGPAVSSWFGGDTLHMAIGQGYVLTTPLQMARVTATLANGGKVLRPFVVDRIVDESSGKTDYRHQVSVVRRVPVSHANIESVRRAMLMTTQSGTGKVVNFPQVEVASKTGSAQVYGQKQTHGWFICFAPYNHPTIAIAAVVEHGGHGGSSAGKVARAMLQAYFKLPLTAADSVRSD